MASQTRSAGLGQSVNRPVGVTNWQNPTNIYSSNDARASVSLDGPYDEEDGEASHYLWATTFGFTIPTDAVIDGIIVEYERYSSNGYIEDDAIYIIKAGSATGNNKAGLHGMWRTSEGYDAYGGVADKWGTTWAYGQINSVNFGVCIGVQCTEWDEYDTARVDHVRITVYYTEVGTNIQIKVGGAWKDVTEMQIKVGGAWKAVTQAKIAISDAWKTIFGA